MAPLAAADCCQMFEVIDDRAEIHATIVVSQFPIENRHQIFADPTVADAVSDRLVHKAIAMRGESMRKVLANAASKEA
ncbi:MAG: ATP-binding protein [Desulfotomaculales bacterium]